VADLLRSGLAARGRGDMYAAIYYYTQAIETRSLAAGDLAIVMNSRGVAYDFKGETRKAISDFDAAIQLKPNFGEAYINRGLAWIKAPDYDRAILDFTEATKHDPKNAHMALSNRGGAYGEKGDHIQAIKDYDAAIRLNRNYPAAYYGRGDSYRAIGEYERALENYSQTIRLVPTFVDAYVNRGATYQQQGDNERAIADYSTAIRIRPNTAIALANRGNAYAMIGDCDRALADLDGAIRLRPNNGFFILQRGRANLYAGRIEAAGDDFAAAVRAQPSSAYASIWLHTARSRAGQDDRQELMANARNVDRTRWPGPLIDLHLGSRKLDDLLASVGAVPSTAEQRKQACDIKFYGAQFLFEKGNRIEAQKLWRQVERDCPQGTIEQSTARAELKRSSE
jgi:tetratricopeptide (TPR) repeat protein